MKKTAIIIPVGFDGSGITTLGIEFSKIGLDVYFKNIVQPLQFRPNNVSSIHLYNSDKELFSLSDDYDRFIFLNFTLHADTLEQSLQSLFELRRYNHSIELCYLHCGRRIKKFGRLLDVCHRNNFDFDYYFSITPNICEYVDNYNYLNINAYTFPILPKVAMSDRKRVILTSGRVDAVKGTTSYFKSIQFGFNLNDFYYVHEGAKFNFNTTGSVSVPFQLLDLFDSSVHPKVIREQYAFSRYGELPSKNKLTLYPTYSLDDIYSRWSTYYAGISCVLGTISSCDKKKTLLGTKYIAQNPIENKSISNRLHLWNDALEYADLEKIAVGLPMFISRHYSEILGFTDENLIYDSFLEIPELVANLSNVYDISRQNQYKFFSDKQSMINQYIVEQFTGEF